MRKKLEKEYSSQLSQKKTFGIDLTRAAKDLYSKNFNTSKKEIKEGTRRCLWIIINNIVRMAIYHNSLRVNAIAIKIQKSLFIK